MLEATETLEQTVINSGLANKPAVAAAKPTTDTQPALDTAHKDKLIEALTPFLGPMAQRLVLRLAKGATTLTELINELASQIPNATQRGQFLNKVKGLDAGTGSSGSTEGKPVSENQTPHSGGTPPGSYKIPDACLNQVSALLAEYVGPLATRMARTASRKASSWEQFGAELAHQIPNPKERAQFVAKLKGIGCPG